jgi:hypothetical protein
MKKSLVFLVLFSFLFCLGCPSKEEENFCDVVVPTDSVIKLDKTCTYRIPLELKFNGESIDFVVAQKPAGSNTKVIDGETVLVWKPDNNGTFYIVMSNKAGNFSQTYEVLVR